MVQFVFFWFLCDHGSLIKVGPPQGVQLNVKGFFLRLTDCFMNELG